MQWHIKIFKFTPFPPTVSFNFNFFFYLKQLSRVYLTKELKIIRKHVINSVVDSEIRLNRHLRSKNTLSSRTLPPYIGARISSMTTLQSGKK